MQQLQGWRKFDDWGSQSAIAEFLGETPGPRPVSELWFGNHPDGPTLLQDGSTLGDLIAQDPKKALGSGILYAFGNNLPFLMKVIAPDETLSLQVHPTKEIAREGYLREEVLGIERTAPNRSYRDMNHKPEMLYALTDFEALIGFRVPRKARRLLEGLEGVPWPRGFSISIPLSPQPWSRNLLKPAARVWNQEIPLRFAPINWCASWKLCTVVILESSWHS